MTGTDLCVNKPHLVPVIFEPPYIYPLALRCDSGSWTPLRGLVISLIGHITLGRTSRDE